MEISRGRGRRPKRRGPVFLFTVGRVVICFWQSRGGFFLFLLLFVFLCHYRNEGSKEQGHIFILLADEMLQCFGRCFNSFSSHIYTQFHWRTNINNVVLNIYTKTIWVICGSNQKISFLKPSTPDCFWVSRSLITGSKSAGIIFTVGKKWLCHFGQLWLNHVRIS